MKKIYKILVISLFVGLFWFLPTSHVLAGQCQVGVNFNATPNPVPENGTLTVSGYVRMAGSDFEPSGTANAGYCYAGTTIVKAVAVRFFDDQEAWNLAPNFNITLEPWRTTDYGFSATFKPADQKLKSGASFTVTAQILTSGVTVQLTASTPITVNIGPATSGSGGGGGGGGGGSQDFTIPNPIGIDTFEELVNIIGKWIFNLSIPIAVIIIIYAGVLMLTSGGDPGRFKKGMTALKYAVIGLAIVLIGKGFVTLIKSILSLKD